MSNHFSNQDFVWEHFEYFSLISRHKYVKQSVVNIYCRKPKNKHFNYILAINQNSTEVLEIVNTISKRKVGQFYYFHEAFKTISALYDKQMVLNLANHEQNE